MRASQEYRKKNFKKSMDMSDMKKRQAELSTTVRKSKREESLKKRRNWAEGAAASPEEPSKSASSKANPSLAEVSAAFSTGDAAVQLEALKYVRKMLSVEHNPPIAEVIQHGMLPRFVQFLQYPDNQFQFQALWALTNVASGTSDQTKAVVDHGAVPLFVQMLSHTDIDLVEQAAWALGNIAGDSPKLRNFVLESGCLPPLLNILAPRAPNNQPRLSLIRNSTWVVSNMLRGKPPPPLQIAQAAGAGLANVLMYYPDRDADTDALWGLSYASDGGKDRVQVMLDSGVLEKVMTFLQAPTTNMIVPALRVAGNIATGNHAQTQKVVDAGILSIMPQLMNSSVKTIRKEACWTLSNIAAGTKAQIQAIIDAHLVPLIIETLSRGDYDVKKEAAWTVSNFCLGSGPEQIQVYCSDGGIQSLCNLLSIKDNSIIELALDSILTILRVGERLATKQFSGQNPYALAIDEAGGLDKIELLQKSAADSIYSKAVKIVEDYFGGEEVDEDALGNANQAFQDGSMTMSFNPPPAAPGSFMI